MQNRRRYSRERASQSLPRINTELPNSWKKVRTNIGARKCPESASARPADSTRTCLRGARGRGPRGGFASQGGYRGHEAAVRGETAGCPAVAKTPRELPALTVIAPLPRGFSETVGRIMPDDTFFVFLIFLFFLANFHVSFWVGK